MKKKYQKPEIAVENFVLSDYISSCNLPEINVSPSSCDVPWLEEDKHELLKDYWYMGWFLGNCEEVDTDGSILGSDYCYQVSTGINVIVSS